MKITGRQIAKGAAWMVLFKFAERGMGLVSTIILARLLLPQDFGLIALAMAVVAVLELLGAFSFDMALIQNQNAQRHHYDTAWTFNVIFAVFGALLLTLIAAPMASFYAEPRLMHVMYWLALGTLVQGFENIGVVAFRKQMEFNKEFRFLVGKKIAAVIVTIPLAFILESYWALVIGILTGKCAGVALSYITQAYRPRFSLAAYHELFHFSKWMLLNNIMNFLRFRTADFIVGKFSGSHVLGLYSVAFEIANLPTTELVAPINRAVFPGYAKMSHDPEELRRGFIGVAAVIALFSLPAALGIAVTADLLVPVMLGPNWLEAIPLIQVLAISGALIAIQNNNTPALLALDKAALATYLGAFTVILLLPSIFVLTKHYGATGTVWAYFGCTLLAFPVNYYFVLKAIRVPAWRILLELWRPVLAVILMSAVVRGYVGGVADTTAVLLQILHLFAAAALGAVTYIAAIVALWHLASCPAGAEQHVLSYLQQRLRRRAAPPSVDPAP